MIHEQSPSLFSIANKDHDDMMDHEVVQIKPEVIESQPDIDYITMTNSDDEEDELISEEGLRVDGRRAKELRRIQSKMGMKPNAQARVSVAPRRA